MGPHILKSWKYFKVLVKQALSQYWPKYLVDSKRQIILNMKYNLG